MYKSRFFKISFLIFIMLFFSTFIFVSKNVLAWGCSATDKNVWFSTGCPGASSSNPLGGSEQWKDFAADVLGGGTSCAIGASSQPNQHGLSYYYQYEYECTQWQSGRDTDHCVQWGWKCKTKNDIVWDRIAINTWPSGGSEGDVCEVRYPSGINPCGGNWGGTSDYRWDPDHPSGGVCVYCSNKRHVTLKGCTSGPVPGNQNQCEEACGASSDCDEVNVDGLNGKYDSATHRAYICNSNCDPEVIPRCNQDHPDCEQGYSCCVASGQCLPDSDYCGPANDFHIENGKFTCNHAPNWFRDYCNSQCQYIKDPNSQCWGDNSQTLTGSCTADTKTEKECTSGSGLPCRCDGGSDLQDPFYVGNSCGKINYKDAFCADNCQCKVLGCLVDHDPTNPNTPRSCPAVNPKCCRTSGDCISSSNYCGEPNTRNGQYCCNNNCEKGNDFVTDSKGKVKCQCGYTDCYNGFCLDQNGVCYFGLRCSDGKWSATNLNSNPSCLPNSNPCMTLQELALNSFNVNCANNPSAYEPAADVTGPTGVPDGIINSRDVSQIAVKKAANDITWCSQRLTETSKVCQATGIQISKSYRHYCYYAATQTCTVQGWSCNYQSKVNCPGVNYCLQGYVPASYPGTTTCTYGITCTENGWTSQSSPLNDYCSGNILLQKGRCTIDGPAFDQLDCDKLDGTYSIRNGYETRDYKCSNGACVFDLIYKKNLNVSANGLWQIKCPDTNNDGKIDAKDVAGSASYYGGKCGARYNSIYDFNDDCKIDAKDIALVASWYGKNCFIRY
jgi:hypothetical protein